MRVGTVRLYRSGRRTSVGSCPHFFLSDNGIRSAGPDPNFRLRRRFSSDEKKPQHFCWGFSLITSLTITYFHTGCSTIIGVISFHGPVRDGKGWYRVTMVIRHNLYRVVLPTGQQHLESRGGIISDSGRRWWPDMQQTRSDPAGQTLGIEMRRRKKTPAFLLGFFSYN
jgi:hypothetical protein